MMTNTHTHSSRNNDTNNSPQRIDLVSLHLNRLVSDVITEVMPHHTNVSPQIADILTQFNKLVEVIVPPGIAFEELSSIFISLQTSSQLIAHLKIAVDDADATSSELQERLAVAKLKHAHALSEITKVNASLQSASDACVCVTRKLSARAVVRDVDMAYSGATMTMASIDEDERAQCNNNNNNNIRSNSNSNSNNSNNSNSSRKSLMMNMNHSAHTNARNSMVFVASTSREPSISIAMKGDETARGAQVNRILPSRGVCRNAVSTRATLTPRRRATEAITYGDDVFVSALNDQRQTDMEVRAMMAARVRDTTQTRMQWRRVRTILNHEPNSRSMDDIELVADFLQGFEVFVNSTALSRNHAARQAIIRQHAPGTTIIRQGERASSILIIIDITIPARNTHKGDNNRVEALASKPHASDSIEAIHHRRGSTTSTASRRVSTLENTSSLAAAFAVRENSLTSATSFVGAIRHGDVAGRSSVVEECDEPQSVIVNGERCIETILLAPSAFISTQLLSRTTITNILPLWNLGRVATGPNGGSGIAWPNATHRVRIAVDFIDDAMHERNVEKHRPGILPLCLRRIRHSSLYSFVLFATIFLHLSLAFFEAPSYTAANTYTSQHAITRIIECCCVLIYTIDIIVNAIIFGRHLLPKPVPMLRVFVTFLFAADLIVAAFTSSKAVRFSRVIRPVILVLYSTTLRQMFFVALRSSKGVLEIFLLLGMLFALYSVVGFNLFELNTSIYSSARENCEACVNLSDSVFTSFLTLRDSLLTLFVLFTTENFPDVSFPSYAVNSGYMCFFVSFTIITVFFIRNVFVATIYNQFHTRHQHYLMAARERERRALHCAFATLDVFDSGYISISLLERVLRELRPNIQTYQILAFYEIICRDSRVDGFITEASFLKICDTLLLNIITEQMMFEHDVSLLSLWREFGYRVALCAMMTRPFYLSMKNITFFVDIIVLLTMQESRDILSLVDLTLSIVFLLNIVLTIHAQGLRRSVLRAWLLFDVIISITHVFGAIVFVLDNSSQLSVLRFIGILRCLHVLNWITLCCREIPNMFANRFRRRSSLDAVSPAQKQFATIQSRRESLNDNSIDDRSDEDTVNARFRNTIETFIHMIPPFFYMCVFFFSTFLYSYAILGMELFTNTNTVCNTSKFIEGDTEARFCDFISAMITLFQILTTSNWHDVMYAARDDERFGVMSTPYFVSFFILAVLYLLNLFTAVFIDMFKARALQQKGELHLSTIVERCDDDENDGEGEVVSKPEYKHDDVIVSGMPRRRSMSTLPAVENIMVNIGSSWQRNQRIVGRRDSSTTTQRTSQHERSGHEGRNKKTR